MRTMLLLVVLSALGTGLWWYLDRVRGRPSSRREELDVTTKLPGLLAKARIFGKEVSVACRTPRRMHGQFDEAFQLEGGELVLSETKSRGRPVVHKSDVIQLSGYALAIAEGGKYRVRSKGYIRLVTPKENKYVEVDLLPAEEVVRLYDKVKMLRSGRDTGDRCGKDVLCRSCMYKAECDAMP